MYKTKTNPKSTDYVKEKRKAADTSGQVKKFGILNRGFKEKERENSRN